jgi:hypothetical protein
MPSLTRAARAVTDLEFRQVYPDGSPVAGCRSVATLDNHRQQRGMLDADGYTRLSGLSGGIGGRIRYLDDSITTIDENYLKALLELIASPRSQGKWTWYGVDRMLAAKRVKQV